MKKLMVILLFLLTLTAYAQQKYALVIGNGNYTSISKLNNPVNDAVDVKAALESLGWTVEILRDANQEQIDSAIVRLKNRLSAARSSYGFVFYAGHAVQSGGENYLIPVDANYQSDTFLKSRAVSVQILLGELNEAGNELNVVVLDACRDNPFTWAKGRGGERGLVVVGDQPANSIIAYACAAGSTAADGTGRNSPFTTSFLNNLKTPGISVEDLFKKTGADVANATGGKQRPALYSQFYGIAYLGTKPVPGPNPNPNPPPTPSGSLYEQLVNATGTTTITVTQDTPFQGAVISKASSIVLRGDTAGRTVFSIDPPEKSSWCIRVERGVTLTLENITLKSITIEIKEGGTLVMNNGSTITGGVYVYVYGTFIMNNGSTITGGNGVVWVGGSFIMNNGSTITGGNGVGVSGSFTMNGGSITNNGTSGVDVSGSFTMNGGSITNNGTSGVWVVEGGTFTMNNGRIANNNNKDSYYGAVFIKDNASFTMKGGRIENNQGDGVYVEGSFYMYGGVIAGNNRGGVYVTEGAFKMTGGTVYGTNAGSNANIGYAVHDLNRMDTFGYWTQYVKRTINKY
jgi:hypothetical protein